jgi:hypothetical protein
MSSLKTQSHHFQVGKDKGKEEGFSATPEFLTLIKSRFEKNMNHHPGLEWLRVEKRLEENPGILWSLSEMERTGGEPDVVGFDDQTKTCLFYDCSAESPVGRRSLCYDQEALLARKNNKPKNSAIEMATRMGIELLTESHYRKLQSLGKFDTKTSSWIQTPVEVRRLGGALFADRRYNQVFVYHNGAESYYASRGFRGMLRL